MIFFRALVFIEELYYLYSLFGVLYSICGEGGKNVFWWVGFFRALGFAHCAWDYFVWLVVVLA